MSTKPLHSDPALPRHDPAHLARVRALGCIICHAPASAHHIRTGYGTSQKAPDHEAIPICFFHHQDGPYGLAFHAGPREWQRNFGTELELLAITREQLEAAN